MNVIDDDSVKAEPQLIITRPPHSKFFFALTLTSLSFTLFALYRIFRSTQQAQPLLSVKWQRMRLVGQSGVIAGLTGPLVFEGLGFDTWALRRHDPVDKMAESNKAGSRYRVLEYALGLFSRNTEKSRLVFSLNTPRFKTVKTLTFLHHFERPIMRLFTHNFLQCHVRNCSQNNFPLQIQQDAEFEIKTAEYNADFLALQMCKIDYSALLQALKEINVTDHNLPEEMPDAPYSEDFLKSLHHAIMEHAIINGKMVCRGCGHIYPVTNGIPNMLLHEDEI